MTPDQPLTVAARGATVTLYPGDSIDLKATYILDYGPWTEIPRQTFTTDIRTDNFLRELAVCRTFLTASEAKTLRSQGVGAHLTTADVVVFGPQGVTENVLRFADEPARHKVLDLIGDLSLCGFDLAGHLIAYRSGHALNVSLACRLIREEAGAETIPMTTKCQKKQRAA
jgi:UDP-3-O-acyl-N-acetylglucosamine deacetylase